MDARTVDENRDYANSLLLAVADKGVQKRLSKTLTIDVLCDRAKEAWNALEAAAGPDGVAAAKEATEEKRALEAAAEEKRCAQVADAVRIENLALKLESVRISKAVAREAFCDGARRLANALATIRSGQATCHLAFLSPGKFDFDVERASLYNGLGVLIAKELATNTTVEWLIISGSFGPESGKALGAALEKNATLKRLQLFGCSLGDVGGAAIGEALQKNATLLQLHLSRCYLGDVGGAAIGEALQKNTTLLELHLNHCDLEAAAFRQELGAALSTNVTLEALSLVDNKQLGEATGTAILWALKENKEPALRFLDLTHSRVPKATQKCIKSVMPFKSTRARYVWPITQEVLKSTLEARLPDWHTSLIVPFCSEELKKRYV